MGRVSPEALGQHHHMYGDGSSPALRLLQLVLCSDVDRLTSHLVGTPPTLDDVQWLRVQGLDSYVYYSLRERALLHFLSTEVATCLQEGYYHDALIEALQHREVTGYVLRALNQAGVETVLMKGTALAHTVYPNPRCRPKGDLDLWIRPEAHDRAIQALKPLGYDILERADRPTPLKLLYGGEQQLRSHLPGTGLLELQWPAIRGEWLRHVATVDHEGIWSRKLPIELDGQSSYVMGSEDLLLHLCLHQAINHQFGFPWMRGFLDISLVIQKLSPDWRLIVERARSWRVATPVWTMLRLAKHLCAASIPDEVLSSLTPHFAKRWAIHRLRLEQAILERQPTEYNHRRLLIQLLMVDQAKYLIRLVWRSLFPEVAWLQARYNVDSGPALWRIRLLHPWHLLAEARS